MKIRTRFLSLALILITVSQLFTATAYANETSTVKYGDYYYNYDFENYESGGFTNFADYFHSIEVTTADGLICNAYGDTEFNSTPGDPKLPNTSIIMTDKNGNKYLNHTLLL